MNSTLIAVTALLASACAVPLRDAKLPPANEGYVAVLSGEMPGAISQVARHSWIIVNVPAHSLRTGPLPKPDTALSTSTRERWFIEDVPAKSPGMHRFELQNSGGDPFQYFGTGDVAVNGVIHYGPSELDQVLHCLESAENRYHHQHPSYSPIPGPNSNTIVDFMLRACDIHVELPATAIGRDYRGLLGASVTSLGTGVQLETPVVGAKVGLEEGVEVHFFDLPLGVHFWPPAITVPVNPGRIGLEDAGHRPAHVEPWQDYGRQNRVHRDRQGERERERKYGLASLYLYSHYARVTDPEDARGLSDLATVGFEARGGYGKRLGYGFGVDLEAGVGLPVGFAYATRLYPLGLTLGFADNTFLGAFVGIGADGIGGHVPGAFEVPAELRLEVDLADEARWGVSARSSLYSGAASRRGDGLFSSLGDELLLSTFARFGTVELCGCPGHMGRGYFFALERGQVLGSAYLGLKFGIEADYGG